MHVVQMRDESLGSVQSGTCHGKGHHLQHDQRLLDAKKMRLRPKLIQKPRMECRLQYTT